jgi:hypothetical protein
MVVDLLDQRSYHSVNFILVISDRAPICLSRMHRLSVEEPSITVSVEKILSPTGTEAGAKEAKIEVPPN